MSLPHEADDQALSHALADIEAEYEKRGLGDIERRGRRTRAQFSQARMDAARNLLDKAVRALDDRDEARARRLLDRAARLPYDEHEDQQPLAMEAQMLLFEAVTDELEESAEDDSAWCDALLATISITRDDIGRAHLRGTVEDVASDHALAPRERAALRRAITPLPKPPEIEGRRLDPTELAEETLALIAVYRAYIHALDASS